MAAQVYTIAVEGGGSFPCREDEFVLSAMLRAGSGPVRHGCCGGGCGVCKMHITGGEYDAAKAMSRAHVSESEQRSGTVLLCCIKPKSDLIIAAIHDNKIPTTA